MKIINYGRNFEIYEDDLKTFDLLPSLTYKVHFNKMTGFSLVQTDDFESKEEKVYGNHEEKITKVLKSFDVTNRSLGIILSGDKGMGKSLFVQLLSEEAVRRNLPVVIVSKAYGGVADFIDKIDQEVLVVFDEFEKMFPIDSNEKESQNDLLSLFDGLSQRKRMYAITVNHLHKLSEFMLNRTGRFHYHIRFSYPDTNEIELYLKDKVNSEYHSEISKVIMFANRVKLNYDSLRAIAFEINQGYTFIQAIGDLNILSTENQSYDVKVTFSNGEIAVVSNQRVNIFEENIKVYDYLDNGDWFSLSFKSTDVKTTVSGMAVDGEDVKLTFDKDEDSYKKNIKVASISITLYKQKGINYNLVV